MKRTSRIPVSTRFASPFRVWGNAIRCGRVARCAEAVRSFLSSLRAGRLWPSRATWAFILVVLILVWAVLNPNVGSRPASPRTMCVSNLRRIALALSAYRQEHGHYPPPHVCDTSGNRVHSWRLLLLPNFGLKDVFHCYDLAEPWNSPRNAALCRAFGIQSEYRCPGDQTQSESAETSYLAVTGPGTVFGEGCEGRKPEGDIPPDTILVVESRASGIPWMAPGDFDIRTIPETINVPDGKCLSSAHRGGFHVLFADGQVWFLSERTPIETLQKFLTVEGARKYSRDRLLRPYVI